MSIYRDCEDYVLDRVTKLEKENEELRAALTAESNENLALHAQLSLIASHANVHQCSSGGSYLDITIWDSSVDYRDIINALDLPMPEEGGAKDE